MKPNKENLKCIFNRMESDGWDVTKSLKWGFFFFSKKEENLYKIFGELSDHKYNLESIHKNEDNWWVMQVSKIEPLTYNKLHRRNIAFNELAEVYDSLYDGWDVARCISPETM